jgi:hypothetical protein
MKHFQLANQLGVSDTTVSTTLNNQRGWKATDTLLDRALKIIEICGGTEADGVNWKAYHDAVRDYQRTGARGEPPQPPKPSERTAQESSKAKENPAADTTGLSTPIRLDGQTPAPPEVPLAVADLKGDVPDRPLLRLAMHVLGFGALFAALTLPLAAELGQPIWQTLMSAGFYTLLPMTALAVVIIPLAATRRRLDAMTRRHQERSTVESVKDVWPGYAAYLLMLCVFWLPVLGMPNVQLRILLTGLAAVFLVRIVQLQVRKVRQFDIVWPPPISPDTLTFRRVANRLHARLIADQSPHDRAWQRQAESVYVALTEVRATLEQRTRRTWHQWLAGGRHNPLTLAIGGALTNTVGLTTTGLVISLGSGDIRPKLLGAVIILAAALVLALVVLTASFFLERSSIRQQVQELNVWDTRLRPLIYSGKLHAVDEVE